MCLILYGICSAAATAGAGVLGLEALRSPGLADEAQPLGIAPARQAAAVAAVDAAAERPARALLIKFRQQERMRTVRVDAADETAALAILGGRADVEFAEPERRLQRQFEPSDALIGSQWHHGVVGSPAAWDRSLGSAAVKVAIVDYAFNMAHPDLAANTVAGYDVPSDTAIFGSGAYPHDDHATLSAGMAAAVVDNGTGVAGAANCSILPIHVDGSLSNMYTAVTWAADNGVRVVNISWTGADSPTLNAAGKYLHDHADGILVMSGVNTGAMASGFTNFPYITAVSMTDSADQMVSLQGDHIDFAAPGKNIFSTSYGGYATASGTSFSAPLLAGILAALFSIDPDLTAEQALAVVRATAEDLGTEGWDPLFGWGRVDYGAAAHLAAVLAAGFPALGIDAPAADSAGLKIRAEYVKGLDYALWGAPSLDASEWSPVACTSCTTNGAEVEFTFPVCATQAFFRLTGTMP